MTSLAARTCCCTTRNFSDHEYATHVGWGHSSIAAVMQFAHKAGVEKVVLFHHDPYHTDSELEELLEEARAKWPGKEDRVCLAHEGMTIVFATTKAPG